MNKNYKSAILSFALVAAIAFAIWVVFFPESSAAEQKIEEPKTKYSEIIGYFQKGEISAYSLKLGSGELNYLLRGKEDALENWVKYKLPNVSLFVDVVVPMVNDYNAANPETPVVYDMERIPDQSFLTEWLPTIVIILAIGGISFFMMRNMGGMGKVGAFGKSTTKQMLHPGRKATFADVAGADEEKEELTEVVEFLKSPAKFTELGARIPKGVLLVGPPGTGKTLLARAVAGEAGVPFFSISGSDFVEMFVGVGASRVRDLFDQAAKNAPAIIFIDEIDAVGRHRGAGLGGGHDEREQTLNQLLVEMDGFGEKEGIIIIAATNRADILDPALLRPGRFDRQVYVGLPDVKGREEILVVHSKDKKPLGIDVDLKTIAKSTVGFSGADLENLLNEAALLAARKDHKAITMPDIQDAVIKVIAGPAKKSRVVSDEDKKITAYHEAGHAVAAFYCDNTDSVHQISIIPRGGAGGYTMYLPEVDTNYVLRGKMNDSLVSALGGRVAESIIFNDVTTGASADLEQVTSTARAMVTKYGFSEKLGNIVYGQGQHEVFLGRDFSNEQVYSDTVAYEIDTEIRELVKAAYDRCFEILSSHRDKLDKVAGYLLEHETCEKEEFVALMEENF